MAKGLEAVENLPLVFGNLKNLLFVYETELLERLAQMAMHDVEDVRLILGEIEVMNVNELFEIINRQDFSIESFELVSDKGNRRRLCRPVIV